MITVMGASGHTGGEIARSLLDAGEAVRALGRSRDRLAPLADAGAEVVVGDAGDPGYLGAAFRDSDAVYTLLPYDPTSPDYLAEQQRIGEAVVTAIREAGVPHVVALSSVGADLAAGTGFVASLHAQERRLAGLDGTNVLILRPGSYFENFVASLHAVREHGVLTDTVAPDVAIPMIATRDIAASAAVALRKRDWSGVVVRELLGPRDLTYAEATALLGARIGMPDLPYVRLGDEEMVAALRQVGFSAATAAMQVELGRALSDGTIVSRQGRTPATTTPTRFEDFVAELVWTS